MVPKLIETGRVNMLLHYRGRLGQTLDRRILAIWIRLH